MRFKMTPTRLVIWFLMVILVALSILALTKGQEEMAVVPTTEATPEATEEVSDIDVSYPVALGIDEDGQVCVLVENHQHQPEETLLSFSMYKSGYHVFTTEWNGIVHDFDCETEIAIVENFRGNLLFKMGFDGSNLGYLIQNEEIERLTVYEAAIDDETGSIVYSAYAKDYGSEEWYPLVFVEYFNGISAEFPSEYTFSYDDIIGFADNILKFYNSDYDLEVIDVQTFMQVEEDPFIMTVETTNNGFIQLDKFVESGEFIAGWDYAVSMSDVPEFYYGYTYPSGVGIHPQMEMSAWYEGQRFILLSDGDLLFIEDENIIRASITNGQLTREVVYYEYISNNQMPIIGPAD